MDPSHFTLPPGGASMISTFGAILIAQGAKVLPDKYRTTIILAAGSVTALVAFFAGMGEPEVWTIAGAFGLGKAAHSAEKEARGALAERKARRSEPDNPTPEPPQS